MGTNNKHIIARGIYTSIGLLLACLGCRLAVCAQSLQLQLPSDVPRASHVEIREFRGGIIAKRVSLSLDTAANRFRYDATGNSGYVELVVDGFNPMPLVLQGEAELVVKPTMEQLKGYTVAGNDTENQALALFLGYALQHSVRMAALRQTLNAQQTQHDTTALAQLVTGFVRAYTDMRTGMTELYQQYPETYAARQLASLYQSPLTLADSPQKTLINIRQHFFDGWNLSTTDATNNPFIIDELDLYFSLFAEPTDELYTPITSLLSRPEFKGKPLLTEPIIDMVSRVLLKNQHPEAEAYAIYMGETFGQTCGLPPTISDHRATIPERMLRMRVGASFPDLTLQRWGASDKLILSQQWSKQPYTLLFFWQSTCPHCNDALPELEKFVASYSADLHTVAVALDRTRAELATYFDRQQQTGYQRPSAWTDCWEPGELTNVQLNKIYLKSTPTFVLLNQQGQVVTTAQTLDNIKGNLSAKKSQLPPNEAGK